MTECKKHPHGLLKSVDSGRYAGYEDAWERVPCGCERTAHGQNVPRVPSHKCPFCGDPLGFYHSFNNGFCVKVTP